MSQRASFLWCFIALALAPSPAQAQLVADGNTLVLDKTNIRRTKRTPDRARPALGSAAFAVLLCLLPNSRLLAQAPAILWSTNLGAFVFGVDSQTNVYATASSWIANGFGTTGSGRVIVLDRDGQVLQTNNVGILEAPNGSISNPVRQGALDPVSGGYYYVGIHPGDLNSGCPGRRAWLSPAFFLAKFSAAGTLVWSVNFGPTNCLRFLGINGLRVDSSGTIYASYDYSDSTINHNPGVAAFNSSGSNLWTAALPPGAVVNSGAPVTLGPVTPSGGFALGFTPGFQLGTLSKFDSQGTASEIITFMVNSSLAPTAERPIGNALGEFYEVEGSNLVKRSALGSFIWGMPLTNQAQFTVGEDYYGGVHTATESGDLSRFDSDGNLAWTLSFGVSCHSMAVGAKGDRFLSLANGTMVALSAENVANPGGSLRLRLDQPGDGMSSQGFHFTLDGDPGFAWQIQRSSNLSQWQQVGNVSNASGKIQFTDPSATNSSRHFYRAQQVQ